MRLITKLINVCLGMCFLYVGAFVVESQAGNSLPQFVDSAAQVDPQSGTTNLSIPIEVPTGRSGVQPGISLQYSSSAPNGIAGVGWLLELGSIQVSTKEGLPKYSAADEYVLMQAGSTQELVFDPAAEIGRAHV